MACYCTQWKDGRQEGNGRLLRDSKNYVVGWQHADPSPRQATCTLLFYLEFPFPVWENVSPNYSKHAIFSYSGRHPPCQGHPPPPPIISTTPHTLPMDCIIYFFSQTIRRFAHTYNRWSTSTRLSTRRAESQRHFSYVVLKDTKDSSS